MGSSASWTWMIVMGLLSLEVVKWDEISTVFPVLNSSKRQYGKTKILNYNKLYK